MVSNRNIRQLWPDDQNKHRDNEGANLNLVASEIVFFVFCIKTLAIAFLLFTLFQQCRLR